MEYKIKNLCDTLGFGVSKFYKLKQDLDCSIPEQNRMEYYYRSGRNFYITEKGFQWFKSFAGSSTQNGTSQQSSAKPNNSISLYQEKIIQSYEKRIEFLEEENKKLLDIIAFKEQKEIVSTTQRLETGEKHSFFAKFLDVFKK